MKCEKCNEREANCYYKTVVNGKVTEAHLCSQCMAEAQKNMPSFFNDFNRIGQMSDRLFDSFFDWRPRISSRLMDPLAGFFFPATEERSETPSDAAPAAETGAEDAPAAQAKPNSNHSDADNEFELIRRKNALRRQMKTAAAKENYEEAARLRDELRQLGE